MSSYKRYEDAEVGLLSGSAANDPRAYSVNDSSAAPLLTDPTATSQHRPSLSGLLSGTQKDVAPAVSMYENAVTTDVSGAVKFGTFNGVFVRCLVSIFGVLMFLLNGWVVGQAGLGLCFVILLLSAFATITTTVSGSALCTNGIVSAGGPYYLVSRSLGVEFGTALGILFFLAQSIAVALNTVGFAQTLVTVYPGEMTAGGAWDAPLIALLTNLIVFVMCLFGVSWLNKVNLLLLGSVFVALFALILGIIIRSPGYLAGFTGLSNKTMAENWYPHFESGYNFFTVAAVFFPSVTGIMAGVNISGDLQDAAKSVPTGTLSAIAVCNLVYIVQFCFLAACATAHSLISNTTFLIEIAIVPALVIAGIFAASWSTALGLQVGAPRILQAVVKDNMFPFLNVFGRANKRGDPIPAYALTFAIACVFSVAGGLTFIASIVTNMYLLVYGLVNYACFAASFARSPGWRPGFRFYNMYLSLSGAVFCLALMFFMDYVSAIVILFVTIVLYKYAEYKANRQGIRLGGAGEAYLYRSTLKTLRQLQTETSDNVRNFRPQLLMLENLCPEDSQIAFRRLVAYFYKSRALIMRGRVFVASPQQVNDDEYWQVIGRQREKDLAEITWKHDIVFGAHTVATSVLPGLREMLNTCGVGRVRPNVLVVHMPSASDAAMEEEFWRVVRCALTLSMGLVVVANASRLTGDAAGWRAKNLFHGDIDVFWLADDGGLTALLPYLLHESSFWKRSTNVRFFVPSARQSDDEMARLLKSLRFKGSTHMLAPQYQRSTALPIPSDYQMHPFTSYIEPLQQATRQSAITFCSLPVPSVSSASEAAAARDYCAYLRALCPPHATTVLVRGNHSNVLTPYL
jgi:amino acid transporter